MCVRAARWCCQGSSGASDYDEGGDIAGLGSNRDMLALKQQMEELGLQVNSIPNWHPLVTQGPLDVARKFRRDLNGERSKVCPRSRLSSCPSGRGGAHSTINLVAHLSSVSLLARLAEHLENRNTLLRGMI